MAEIFSFLSLGFIPIMSAVIILHGLIKRAPIYDYFIEGAKTGLRTALDILPFLVGIFIAVNSLTASGVLNLIDVALSPVLDLLDIPAQLLPLMFLRAISGSGSLIICLLYTSLLHQIGSLICIEDQESFRHRLHRLHHRRMEFLGAVGSDRSIRFMFG